MQSRRHRVTGRGDDVSTSFPVSGLEPREAMNVRVKPV